VQVILPTAILYVAAGVWYAVWARRKVLPVAPEEVAARIADQLARNQAAPVEVKAAAAGSTGFVSQATAPLLAPADPRASRRFQMILERIVAPVLFAGILSLIWMILRARGVLPGVFSERVEVTLVTLLWALLFVLVSAVGLTSARNHGR
jgi:hypothetical protein